MKLRFHAGIAGLIIALMPLSALAQSSPAGTTRVALTGGTPIAINLNVELSSSTAHEGDVFGFHVASDVRSNGWLVIAAGAQGVGEVVRVEHAGGSGHPGKLELQFDYVYAVDGEKVRVTHISDTVEGEARTGAASTATIAAWATLGAAGLFAHNWVKGREVTITPRVPFSLSVETTVHVSAADHRAIADDFAH